LVFTFATAALTSLGTTSPRYNKQHALVVKRIWQNSHVFALPWVTLDKLIVALEARNGHFRDRVGFMEG
jgi:hypothetical protein